MKTLRNRYKALLLAYLLPLATLQASPIKWEIHQAFPSWVEGESWMVFAKITNEGDDMIPLASDLAGFEIEQIRVVPKWKDGMQPYLHGYKRPTTHLLQVDQPWKSRVKWDDVLKAMIWGRALKPSQSEVVGELGLREILVEKGMPDPHMESFQFALRVGPDRYALSESQPLVFADVIELQKNPILAKIDKANGRTTPIRQIEIDGESWLFQRSFRIARVPEGATPRFRTEDGKETLVIEFDGVEEEPVRVNIAQAFPLSGSKRTVPHLHLWRSLTDRSMFKQAGSKGGFWKESGLTLEQALALKWDGTDSELKVAVPLKNSQREPGKSTTISDQKEEAASLPSAVSSIETTDEKKSAWIWIILAVILLGALVFLFKRRVREL
jgi:hypothetical protein